MQKATCIIRGNPYDGQAFNQNTNVEQSRPDAEAIRVGNRTRVGRTPLDATDADNRDTTAPR